MRRRHVRLRLELELCYFLALGGDEIGAGQLYVLDERRRFEVLHELRESLDVDRLPDDAERHRIRNSVEQRIRASLARRRRSLLHAASLLGAVQLGLPSGGRVTDHCCGRGDCTRLSYGYQPGVLRHGEVHGLQHVRPRVPGIIDRLDDGKLLIYRDTRRLCMTARREHRGKARGVSRSCGLTCIHGTLLPYLQQIHARDSAEPQHDASDGKYEVLVLQVRAETRDGRAWSKIDTTTSGALGAWQKIDFYHDALRRPSPTGSIRSGAVSSMVKCESAPSRTWRLASGFAYSTLR